MSSAECLNVDTELHGLVFPLYPASVVAHPDSLRGYFLPTPYLLTKSSFAQILSV